MPSKKKSKRLRRPANFALNDDVYSSESGPESSRTNRANSTHGAL